MPPLTGASFYSVCVSMCAFSQILNIVKINTIFLFLELPRQLRKTRAFPEMPDFRKSLRQTDIS